MKKPMPACTGREILAELCFHLGIADKLDEVVANTKVRLALMPYITAQFMPRAAGDRPRIVPQGCVNLGLVGQFVETSNDVVFTVESSVRTGRIAAYSLLGLPKQVPDIAPDPIRHPRASEGGQDPQQRRTFPRRAPAAPPPRPHLFRAHPAAASGRRKVARVGPRGGAAPARRERRRRAEGGLELGCPGDAGARQERPVSEAPTG